jgi:hypothetical protein
MKKFKLLLLSISLLVGFSSFAANLDIKFTNMKISGNNLVFDIEVQSNTANTYIGGLEFYINYNTAGFGSNIAPSVTANPAGGILSGFAYSHLKSNNSASRLKLTAYISSSQTRAMMPTTYGKVYTVTMPIVNANNNAGINIQMSLMGTGQVYYTVITGGTPALYTPVNQINNLTTLPLNPNVLLLISEVGDPSNSSTNFVEIYNAGSTSVDFDNHYAWYLNVNGSSTIKLTGTFAASTAYTIAYDAVDFTATLTNNAIGTGGTSNYLLTTYGDYTNGTSIDVYNGSTTGFDFTGKHAVRIYNIASPNVTMTASEWSISAAQNTDMTAGSHHADLTWNGSTATWRSKTNWTGGFIPDAGHNVIINGGITPVISFGTNATAYDLSIGSAGLNITSVEGTGDGSLITYGTVTGTANIERFLKADRFWYVTQPVTSATANVFLHTWLFTYESGAWTQFIEDENTPLVPMKGYAVWTSNSQKYDANLPPLGDTTTAYTGTPNSGAQSTALGAGWNFTGNPYPSAVDWKSAYWTKTNLVSDAYSVWVGCVFCNPDGGTYGTYTVGSGGTNGTTQFIPAAQGIMVNASGAGALGATNAVRTHNPQAFWKDEEVMQNRLSLKISQDNFTDETVIYFNEEATTEHDYLYDARKLMAEASPQAYTILGEEKMAINTFNNPSQTNKVTMGVNIPADGEYSIIASNMESFDGATPLYLEDILTGQKINLRETSAYTFTANEGATERFVVHFAEYQGIGDNTSDEVNSIYAVDQTIYVDFSGTRGEIAIYNILGQEINRAIAGNGMNKVSVPYGNTVYIVKVISDNSTVTKKVFVK